VARADEPGPQPPVVAGSLLRLVLGSGHAGGGRRRGAPGAPAGSQRFQPPPGQERARRPRSGRPAPDGRLAEAWIAPAEIRELREITRYRGTLVQQRTSCKDQVHGVLAKLGIEVTGSDIFGAWGPPGHPAIPSQCRITSQAWHQRRSC